MRWTGLRPRRRRGWLAGLGPWRKVLLLASLAFGIVALLEQTGGPLTGRCRVIAVTDGDTVRAFCPGRAVGAVRLIGFDTPEVYSPRCLSEWLRGMQATGYLGWRILAANELSLVLNGRDRYGRHLGRLRLDGRGAAAIMVEAGLARRYSGEARRSWCA